MARKTVAVAYLLERGNYFLKHSEDSQVGERKGTASMIELALTKADAYKGFGYLDSAKVDYEALHNGEGAEAVEAAFKNADETRRVYHRHPGI
jgi:hypothetical protein